MGGWGDHRADVRVNCIVKVEIPATRVVVRRDNHCMRIIAKLVSTISSNVVLIFRSVLIRLRASVFPYEVIEGEIASCIGRNATRKTIFVCENDHIATPGKLNLGNHGQCKKVSNL